MKDRIKELRKSLGMTQEAFSARVGIKRNTVAQYELGRNPPTDTVITLICREFGVNELWLRYGDGDMFVQKHPNEEIEGFMMNVLRGEDGFKRRFARMVARLTEEEWEILERKMRELMEE